MNENKKPNPLLIVSCMILPFITGYFFYAQGFQSKQDYPTTNTGVEEVYLTPTTGDFETGNQISGERETSNDFVIPSEDRLNTKINDKRNITIQQQDKPKDQGSQEVERTNPTTTKFSKVRLKGFPEDSIAQDYANYAYKIGGENLLFVILCENGGLDMKLQSKVISNGRREQSYGLCQLQYKNYPDVDKQRFLTDWQYQLDKCREKRQGGTLFFGPQRQVHGMTCHAYAKKYLVEFIK